MEQSASLASPKKSGHLSLLGLPLCRAASGGGPSPPEAHRPLPFWVSHTHLMLKQKAYTEKSVSQWNTPQADPKATLDSCLFFFFFPALLRSRQ